MKARAVWAASTTVFLAPLAAAEAPEALRSAEQSTEVFICTPEASSLEIIVTLRGGVVTWSGYPLLVREPGTRWVIADGLGRSLVLDKLTGNFGFSFVYRETDDTIFGNFVSGTCLKSKP